MSDNEKRISFLNRYVIYRKTRNVDIDDSGDDEPYLQHPPPPSPPSPPSSSLPPSPSSQPPPPPSPPSQPSSPPQSKSLEMTRKSNWMNEFMKNDANMYGIIDNEGCGDCFFATFRDALKSVQITKSVKDLREIVSDELTQAQFDNYKTLYNFHKQEVTTLATSISNLNNQIKQLKQQTSELGKSAEDKKKKINIRTQALELQTKKAGLKSEKDVANAVVKNELAFMKSASSLEDLKAIIKTSAYWTDGWAIATLEQVLNIKVILMSSKAFEDNDLINVLICGESIDRPVFTPDYYIILDYTSIHYKLITYDDKRIFTFAEIPLEIKNKIRTLCLGYKSGAFSIIPDFIE